MAARRDFASNWWGRRWLEVLESFGWANRLQRGRTYARQGKVLHIDLKRGEVNARVQGTRPKPYNVRMKIKPFSERDWERISDKLAGQAHFAARLLNGEMPQDIETVFAGVKLSLFPQDSRDIITSCSCPDWANPCKHIAAVYYLLGERFDTDPFLLFLIRGRSKEELLATIREKWAGQEKSAAVPDRGAAEVQADAGKEELPLELPLDPDDFWRVGEELASVQIDIKLPAVPQGVLKRLGPPPVGLYSLRLQQLLAGYYREISRRAYDMAYDDETDA